MTRIYPCPSPYDCQFTTDESSELAEHVNSEHAGEFKRDDWPDMPAGRRMRAKRRGDLEEADEE